METNVIDTTNILNVNGGPKDNAIYVNISERHKTFLWLWSKTGTTHMKNVLKYFGFQLYEIQNGVRTLHQPRIEQIHSCHLFEGHENYKLLISARNPYSRFVSDYRFSSRPKIFDLKDFEKFLFERTQRDPRCYECSNFINRKPDYWVRTEHMYEDYLKIPFIKDTDLVHSGLLEKMCSKKVNENPSERTWQDYYNQERADLVFYNLRNYFEFFGYEKDSWKK